MTGIEPAWPAWKVYCTWPSGRLSWAIGCPAMTMIASEYALTCTAATAQAALARIRHSTQVTGHLDVIPDSTSRLVRQMVHVEPLTGQHRLTAAGTRPPDPRTGREDRFSQPLVSVPVPHRAILGSET
jgi:hypothetical protein